ncbi:LysR family transcriptional regulator [Lutimaribacter marinistellae]|uniref:LysR family transcriptional regulator n=1 Tax=Lutimaribacter marinistellae TaxID=1820329 RepID=A0ABV7TNG5_9RHOB
MRLSLKAMRYAQAAMRSGSITGAAQTMNVAPSAIATALGQAEEAFGVTLVTRARAKGVFPTLAGREILRRLDDLLERYDSLLSDANDLQSGLSGRLSIGYNAPVAPAFLPSICAHLQCDHPDLSFSLLEGTNTEIRGGLVEGQFDVILFVEEMPDPQIETRALIFAPTYCLCPADHPLAKQDSVAVEQIAREPLILLDRPAARGYYLDLLEKSGASFEIVATGNSTEMVRSLVAAGIGLSLLNMRPGDAPSYAGSGIRCLPIKDSTSGVTISMGFPPGPRRQVLQVFIDCCEAYFDGPKGHDLVVRGPV